MYIEHNTRILVPHIRGFSPFYHVLMVLLEKLNNKKKEAPNSSIQEPTHKGFSSFLPFHRFQAILATHTNEFIEVNLELFLSKLILNCFMSRVV